jgi:hypothetical protein
MKFVLIAILFTVRSQVFAKEKVHRQHGAHQHGAGTLGIAFEDKKGRLEFKIPSDSIIGFEYTPKTDKDISTKKTQLEKLEKNISDMVVFDSKLKCVIAKDKIEVVKDEKESAETHSEHSDTFATFNVNCESAIIDTEITFNFQKYFPRIQDLDVQVIAESVQKSVEAKQNGTKIEIKL